MLNGPEKTASPNPPGLGSILWMGKSVRLRGSLPIVDNESGDFLCIAKAVSAKAR